MPLPVKFETSCPDPKRKRGKELLASRPSLALRVSVVSHPQSCEQEQKKSGDCSASPGISVGGDAAKSFCEKSPRYRLTGRGRPI